MSDERYVIPFEELRMTDVEDVGGKNASLGEMISQLSSAGVRVPGGFATTALAFRDFLRESGLDKRIDTALRELDIEDLGALTVTGSEIRKWIVDAPFAARLRDDIGRAYQALTGSDGDGARSGAGDGTAAGMVGVGGCGSLALAQSGPFSL